MPTNVTADGTAVPGISGTVSYTAALTRPGGGAHGVTYFWPSAVLAASSITDTTSYNAWEGSSGTGPADLLIEDVFVQQGAESNFLYDGGAVASASATLGGGLSAPALDYNDPDYESTLTWFAFSGTDYDGSNFGGPFCAYILDGGEGGGGDPGEEGDDPFVQVLDEVTTVLDLRDAGTAVNGVLMPQGINADTILRDLLEPSFDLLATLESDLGSDPVRVALMERVEDVEGHVSSTYSGGVPLVGSSDEATVRELHLDLLQHLAEVLQSFDAGAGASALNNVQRLREGRVSGVIINGIEQITAVTPEIFSIKYLEFYQATLAGIVEATA